MLILRRPWTEQPQDAAEVDLSDTRTRGLLALTTGDAVVSLAPRVTLSATRGAPVPDASRSGRGVKTNGSTDSRYWSIPSVALTQWTLFGILKSNGSALDTRAITLGSSSSNTPILAIGVHTASSSKFRFWPRDDADFPASGDASAGDVFDGTDHYVVHTYDGQTLSLYIDGRLDSTDTTWVGKTITVDRFSAGALERAGAAAFWAGTVFLAGACNRCWTAAEAALDPWQLFAPRQIWIPATAAGTNPTLSLPTYVPGSLTSSAFRPRVTATWS
jgi:hypothetical protein